MLHENDFSSILTILKSQNNVSQSLQGAKNKFQVNWGTLMNEAYKMEIDDLFINRLHLNFDIDDLTFKTTFLERSGNLKL